VPSDLKAKGWEDMVWIDLAQDWNKWWAVKNAGMDLSVPYSARKFHLHRRVGISARL
jgi:hypothetical protein